MSLTRTQLFGFGITRVKGHIFDVFTIGRNLDFGCDILDLFARTGKFVDDVVGCAVEDKMHLGHFDGGLSLAGLEAIGLENIAGPDTGDQRGKQGRCRYDALCMLRKPHGG